MLVYFLKYIPLINLSLIITFLKEYLQGNPEKAKKELGWKPKTTFNVSFKPSHPRKR